MSDRMESLRPLSLPGLSGEVEGFGLVLESLGEKYGLPELMCRSGAAFRLYYHRGRHLSGISGRWTFDAFDYRSWDPFALLADHTGYSARPLGDLSCDEAWDRVRRSLDEERAVIARDPEKIRQPCLVVGYGRSEGTKTVRLRIGPDQVIEREFANIEMGPPFNRWIERMLLIEPTAAGKGREEPEIAPVLALAVRLAREGERGGDGGDYSAGLAAYADWARSLRGNIRAIMGFDPAGYYRVQFTAAMLDDLEERRRLAAEYLTARGSETTAIHAGGLYSEAVSVLDETRKLFPRPWQERFAAARDALVNPDTRSRLADAIDQVAQLERRAVEKMEEKIGRAKSAA